MHASQRPLTYSTVGKGSMLLFALSLNEELEIELMVMSRRLTSYRVPSKVRPDQFKFLVSRINFAKI